MHRKFTPYLFLAPHLLFFIGFLVIPVFYGIYISLHNWDYLTEPEFIGFENYQRLLFMPDSIEFQEFWNAFGNTLYFVVWTVPLLIIVPLALALGVNAKVWGRNWFRSIFFVPTMFSVATIVLIWVWILDTNAGVVNYYLGQTIPWLSDIPWVWVSLVLITVWWTAGTNMILFLAGLQEIPDHLYEAAWIDGANAWQRFVHVTLPGLTGPFTFVTIMTTVASFNVFGQPHMATQGGPGTETEVLMMHIRTTAFSDFQMGSAAAMALIMAVFLLIISYFQFRFHSRTHSR
jgi:multiple sugar transport system permease protein